MLPGPLLFVSDFQYMPVIFHKLDTSCLHADEACHQRASSHKYLYTSTNLFGMLMTLLRKWKNESLPVFQMSLAISRIVHLKIFNSPGMERENLIPRTPLKINEIIGKIKTILKYDYFLTKCRCRAAHSRFRSLYLWFSYIEGALSPVLEERSIEHLFYHCQWSIKFLQLAAHHESNFYFSRRLVLKKFRLFRLKLWKDPSFLPSLEFFKCSFFPLLVF